jgi:hypothetical protein
MSGTTRLRGKHSILRIHSWAPQGELNGSNGWAHNLEARELANDTRQVYSIIVEKQSVTPETR